MNRRNFILGLGTAATLSGAASVTSAAITNTTEPGADFRVISDEALDVRRNTDIVAGGEVDEDLSGYVNTSTSGGDYTDGQEGDLNFSAGSPVYDSTGPNLTVDGEDNGALNVSLVTLNDNSTAANRNSSLGGNPLYLNGQDPSDGSSVSNNNPLEVENLGSSDAEVGVSYTYGTDGTGNESLVNTLFTFVDPTTGSVISPTGSDGTHNSNFLTVSSGTVEDVGLVINYSEDIANTLANNFSSGFGGASDEDLDLLDTVEFGVNSA